MSGLFAFSSQWQLYMCWKCQMQSKSFMGLVVQDLGWFPCERSPLHIFLWQSKLQNEKVQKWRHGSSTQRGGCHHGRLTNLFFYLLEVILVLVPQQRCQIQRAWLRGAMGVLLVRWAPVKFGVIRQSFASSVLMLCSASWGWMSKQRVKCFFADPV